MKVLILTFGFPSKKNPQIGCFMLDQAKALKKNGYEIAMLAIRAFPTLKGKKHFGLNFQQIENIPCYEYVGVPTRALRYILGNKISNSIDKIVVPKIFNKLKDGFNKPDLIHAHFLPNIYLATLIKSKYKIPIIGTEHWSEVTFLPVKKFVKDLCKNTYPKVDALISVSKNLQEKIYEYSGVKSQIIHNLFELENLRPALKETNNNRFTIIAVGSLIKRKGFDLLLNAIAISNLKDKNIIVKIFGKGKEYKNLSEQIKCLGLSNKVSLMGQKDKKFLYEELHKADLFVLPSRLENFSVALIEATANGVPAIATLCGGVEEYPIPFVTKIPVEDIMALKEALENSYMNKTKVDRLSIQGATLDNFSPEIIVDKIEKIYQRILNK